jgi:Zn-dependent peptidase ImmA (M78 family)
MPSLVVLNSDQPADRMRFTLAHELGHIVMHKFPSPNMEQEAHAFANAFLTPAADIKPYFRGKRIDLALLASLKPEWRVSMGSLLMCANKLGYLDDGRNKYLWKQMSMKGFRLREPPELDFDREIPTVLKSILDIHLGALGYTEDELSALLHIRGGDARELYGFGRSPSDEGRRPKFTILK